MTGFAYLEMLVEVYERFAAGDTEGAEDVFDVYLPLLRYEAQPGVGLAVRKELLFRRGALASPAVRAPGPTSRRKIAGSSIASSGGSSAGSRPELHPVITSTTVRHSTSGSTGLARCA